MKQGKTLSFLFILITVLISLPGFNQDITLSRVEPPSWWTGFKNTSLQLLVYGNNISVTTPQIKVKGISIEKINKVQNPDYLFIDLNIAEDVNVRSFRINFLYEGKVSASYDYTLNKRLPGSSERKGFSSADVIYLLMPDRFSDGDTTNNFVPGMLQQTDRNDPGKRHGGDIAGIISHLDYLEKMGFTAIWSTPLLENNIENYPYHGYSITDHYKIDPRLGTNDDYRKLVGEAHERGIKVIADMVFNHCGLQHWWMKDLPSDDWIHQFPKFTRTSYRIGTVSDPYLSRADSIQFQTGWFDVTMPDLNQDNPFLAKYLIQNSLWWIEYSGIDGIRVDTYGYCNKYFMADWDKAVRKEYPNINIVGECWSITPEAIAYWQDNSKNADGYDSDLPVVIDFALYDAIRLGFMEDGGWNTGIFRLYDILSRDFIYPDKNNILTFADNHDVGRYLASQDQNVKHLKMAMAFLMTTRGIPQVYYGTEALITTKGESSNEKNRSDFPGGWAGDKTDFFTGKNISPEQQDMKEYMTTLLNWRKNKKVIHSGSLKHFIPSDNAYVYFRFDNEDTVMVIINSDKKKAYHPDVARFKELIGSHLKAKDIITGRIINTNEITVDPETAVILELQK